jgi:AmmeMemoRadiSam system protein B
MEKCVLLGERIADIVGENGRKGKAVGVIASSDFSHYVDPRTIMEREAPLVGAILKLDVPVFFDALSSSDASVCGYGPIAVLMACAKKLGLRAKDLHNSDSGGPRAVSYRAIGFG